MFTSKFPLTGDEKTGESGGKGQRRQLERKQIEDTKKNY
jgi:hypothetical protein